MYTTVIYIIFERGISFLISLKLFEFSGSQTKMVFKQSFKYLKNEIINLCKVILKLECLYQNICSDQTWNLHNHGIFSTNYIIIVKKYFKRPNKIYVFRINSTRSTKWCKNLSQIF